MSTPDVHPSFSKGRSVGAFGFTFRQGNINVVRAVQVFAMLIITDQIYEPMKG